MDQMTACNIICFTDPARPT